MTFSSPPPPTRSLAPILHQYRDKGVKVVTWDLDVSDSTARDAYAGIMDLPMMGYQLLDDTVKYVGGEPNFEYAILNGPSTSVFLAKRLEKIKERQATRWPDLKLTTIETSEGDIQTALRAAQNILTTYPNIKAILCNSTENAIPICQAIDQAGKAGKVKFIGLGTPKALWPYFESGSAGAISMWDPGKWGEWGAVIGIALHEGKTFEEGPLPNEFPGYRKAEKIENETYYYNEMFTYDKDNVFDFDWYGLDRIYSAPCVDQARGSDAAATWRASCEVVSQAIRKRRCRMSL